MEEGRKFTIIDTYIFYMPGHCQKFSAKRASDTLFRLRYIYVRIQDDDLSRDASLI
jgi:hypothetical protein